MGMVRPRPQGLGSPSGRGIFACLRPSTAELLCAIDSWLNYRDTGRSRFVVHIAVNVVNGVDYALGDDVGHYSINNMLGAPEMVEEYRRQQRMLVQGRTNG